MRRPQSHSAIEEFCVNKKIPMTPSGIETATFRFVAQRLNFGECTHIKISVYMCVCTCPVRLTTEVFRKPSGVSDD